VEGRGDGWSVKWNFNLLVMEVERGKGRRGGVDSVGELKEVARCFISSSTEHGRAADGDSARRGSASRGQRRHRV
jgi:hypothetical protein